MKETKLTSKLTSKLTCSKYQITLTPEKGYIFIYVKAGKGNAYMGAAKTKDDAIKFLESSDAEYLIKAALNKHKRNLETGNNYSLVFYECGYDGERQRDFENYYQSKYGLHV